MKPGLDFIGVGVGAAIFDEQGHLFLQYRGPKCRNNRETWSIPGGMVEYGEGRVEALRREILEELDCELEILQELYTVEDFIDDQHWLATRYLCRALTSPRNLEPEKHPRVGWFTLEEAEELPLALHMPLLLEHLKKLKK